MIHKYNNLGRIKNLCTAILPSAVIVCFVHILNSCFTSLNVSVILSSDILWDKLFLNQSSKIKLLWIQTHI